MERTYYYTQQQRRDRGRAMSLTGGNDLAAPGGESQHRSTPMRRGTLISPGESPMRAHGHVLRYMRTCTGPGALALASLQDEQGPARAASSCAHVQGPAEHNCRRKSTTLETAPSLERQGPACSSRSPRICICHTLLGACLFCLA